MFPYSPTGPKFEEHAALQIQFCGAAASLLEVGKHWDARLALVEAGQLSGDELEGECADAMLYDLTPDEEALTNEVIIHMNHAWRRHRYFS